MLNFGTGSFFREDDNSLESPQIQSLYGIREVPVNQVIEREDLLVQQITWQSSVVSGGQQRTVREFSNNTYDMSGNANSQEKGWVLDLVYQSNRQGERVISSATFPSGFGRSRVRFSSLIPSGDVCDFGRVGFNFDLDLATGGRTVSSVFDINEDGLFTKADMVDGRVINAITGGFGEAPATVQDRSNRRDLLYGGDGTLIISADPDEFMAPGRQSWQQLR
jgi:type IV pilus assembly protein PilY1